MESEAKDHPFSGIPYIPTRNLFLAHLSVHSIPDPDANILWKFEWKNVNFGEDDDDELCHEVFCNDLVFVLLADSIIIRILVFFFTFKQIIH